MAHRGANDARRHGTAEDDPAARAEGRLPDAGTTPHWSSAGSVAIAESGAASGTVGARWPRPP